MKHFEAARETFTGLNAFLHKKKILSPPPEGDWTSLLTDRVPSNRRLGVFFFLAYTSKKTEVI